MAEAKLEAERAQAVTMENNEEDDEFGPQAIKKLEVSTKDFDEITNEFVPH